MRIYIIVDLPGVQVSLYEFTLAKARETAEGFVHPTVLALDLKDILRLLRILEASPEKTKFAITKLEEYAKPE